MSPLFAASKMLGLPAMRAAAADCKIKGSGRQQMVKENQTALRREVAQSMMATIVKAARNAPCNQRPFSAAFVNQKKTIKRALAKVRHII